MGKFFRMLENEEVNSIITAYKNKEEEKPDNDIDTGDNDNDSKDELEEE